MSGPVRRWPLFLIASPAAVAVWSGWVGLGTMCGFGVIHPLPGIWDALRVNTAITLPIGVEAYGAYALGAWLTPGTAPAAKKFARRSALGALALGMTGQVIYHLLAAAHAARAPWPVVVLVSSLPVITLGFGAALTHLLRAPAAHLEDAPAALPETVPEVPGAAPVTALVGTPADGPRIGPAPAPRSAARPARSLSRSASRKRGARMPEVVFAAELEAGTIPSVRAIKARCRVGHPKARTIREELAALIEDGEPVAAAS